MQEFVKLGSSINPDIKLTGDCTSHKSTGMMPALDIQLWMKEKKVRHQHYRKPTANSLVMMRCSAMPKKIKRTSRQQNWFRAGGHHVPVFVPHTPGSELARRMRAKEQENNQGRKI